MALFGNGKSEIRQAGEVSLNAGSKSDIYLSLTKNDGVNDHLSYHTFNVVGDVTKSMSLKLVKEGLSISGDQIDICYLFIFWMWHRWMERECRVP